MLLRIFSRKYVRYLLILAGLYGLVMFIIMETSLVEKVKDYSQQQATSVHYQNDVFIELVQTFNLATTTRTRTTKTQARQLECPLNQLPVRRLENETAETDTSDNEKVLCKPHTPSRTACAFVRDFFKYDFNKWSCSDSNQETLQICSFQTDSRSYQCDYSKCNFTEAEENIVVIHLFDFKKEGRVKPLRQGFKDSKSLTEYVSKFARTTLKRGFPFLFLSCGLNVPKGTQLLVLEPRMLAKSEEKVKLDTIKNKINVNVVFLDSISRAHFYRSLKRTINLFGSLNTRNSDQAEVLDFQLFQSIHGHTTENILALMTGKTFPKTITDTEKENMRTEFPKMLEFVRDHGYETLYQEDMCWEGMWGLNSDLGSYSRWEDMYEQIKTNSYIQDTGLTFAACKMIESYAKDTKHVFNHDEKICYNGLTMDSYYLKYLSKKMANTKSPLFSFTALNIAHDPTGRRVQGIDEDLKNFVDSAKQLPNTLTILFSDHGNTYNDFVYVDIEGRYEMFHPLFFMVIPDGVRKTLGQQFMNNLRQNQNRLFNLVDIHHTIKHVIDGNHPNKGILTPISLNRTCGDIHMSMPNLCVCDGWDSPIDNTTELMPYVDFAFGHINNIISEASPTMKCKRLVPTSFQNVLQRKVGDAAILSFDIITSPGHGSKNEEERISVEVSHKISDEMKHFDTKLISYDRVSRFGEYRSCSDADMKFRYCVCDMTKQQHQVTSKLLSFKKLLPVRNKHVYEMWGGLTAELIYYIVPKKIGLLVRRTKDSDKNLASVTFEALSYAGFAGSYEIEIVIGELNNMKPLTNKPCKGVIKANGMLYLCTLGRKWSIWAADFSYKVKHRRI